MARVASKPKLDNALIRTVRGALTKLRPSMTPSQMRTRIIELCNTKNYDPVEAIIDMVQKDQLDADQRIAIHREMLQYVAPKVKSVDVTGEIDMSITVNVKQFSLQGPVSRSVITSQPIIDIPQMPVKELKKAVKNA